MLVLQLSEMCHAHLTKWGRVYLLLRKYGNRSLYNSTQLSDMFNVSHRDDVYLWGKIPSKIFSAVNLYLFIYIALHVVHI